MLALMVGVAGALAACGTDSKEQEYVERPVEQLYNEAVSLLEAQEYEDAADAFNEVERQHPYSIWATKAQLMAAYSHYEDNKYDDAIVALDRFIQLHPGNRDIAYAYYLKAISYYEQIADVRRDQEITRQATDALREIANRFPNTKYARDARFKMDLARDHMAGKEMSVGRFYLREKHYLAALNRFKRVVADFDQTTHVPEALYRIVEINMILGLDSEAKKVAAVLGYNYPGSDWYVDAYQLITGETIRDPVEDTSWYEDLFDWI
ncbi:outer membrane protein assembly factor BamD [Roseospira marina]|uniref:outer membrane protein assembly factor BamD n=1 Tax=Roseospira marina TaxID=140057 RepID=UPI00185B9D30|nr:outer membrane protein assembly factor BamD [Roseospira marina]MBB4315089.1 outer membrane protein assembly factor BamD [Roseospira marina]MBB5088141.1 outer membrane protein assembly factor BamD [Roseospira marina]